MRAVFAFSLVIVLSTFPAFSDGPSFDCKRASSPDEIAICENERLASLDLVYAISFEYVRGYIDEGYARNLARQVLQRRQHCGSDMTCIEAAIDSGIAEYHARMASNLRAYAGVSGSAEAFCQQQQNACYDVCSQFSSDGTMECETGCAPVTRECQERRSTSDDPASVSATAGEMRKGFTCAGYHSVGSVRAPILFFTGFEAPAGMDSRHEYDLSKGWKEYLARLDLYLNDSTCAYTEDLDESLFFLRNNRMGFSTVELDWQP